jgi:Flp pilus assembly protein TadG
MTVQKSGSRAIGALRGRCSSFVMRFRFWREDRGDALVEVALIVSLVLFPMLVGIVELGITVFDSIEISNAAHAGAMYGMISSTYAANSTGITTAAQAEAPEFNTALGVAPSIFYVCSSSIGGTQYSTQTAANTACTGASNHSLEFVQVSTSATITPAIRCPGLPNSFILRGYSAMEVAQ